MLTISTNDFSISLEFGMYERDAIISVNITSAGFCGGGKLDVSRGIIEVFAKDLQALYETLNGTARLCETYGEGYVEFEGDGKGRIDVRGLVVGYSENRYMSEQRLSFENIIDQTFLAELCEEILVVL